MNPRVEFDLKQLKKNIINLQKKTSGIKFLFPVKCCNNNKVIEIMANSNFGFDVSNKNELKVIKEYSDNHFISVSGPLSFELNNSNDRLHIFSNNLDFLKDNNGLRINFNSNPNFEFSRFGIDYKNTDKKILKNIKYVHFHNSDHRNIEKCTHIYNEVKDILNYFPNLQILNIGGHLEDLSFEEGIVYLNSIRKIVPNNIEIYSELGDYIFKDVGTLFCEIVDVIYYKDRQLVTLNFSKMANQRWAYPSYKEEENVDLIKTTFYGCTCCETDIYMDCYARRLNVGEKLKFKNISPYSYQWNINFNGVEQMNYLFKE